VFVMCTYLRGTLAKGGVEVLGCRSRHQKVTTARLRHPTEGSKGFNTGVMWRQLIPLLSLRQVLSGLVVSVAKILVVSKISHE
jgi:hypothetical protein